ncbi:MAG TPA: carbonic anhydrase [Stellaceae bacterium]|nr:carbonic anhydrase [Stellaceae bacterium]
MISPNDWDGPEDRVCPCWSRRRFLRATVIGGVTLGAEFAGAGGVAAQSTLGPEAAVQMLLDGNRRFTEGRLTSFDEDLALLKQKTAEKQEPFAAVLSCADSRVPVELVFDQSIGHVFVARVAGNIATSELIASLEYGAAVLGTKAIMVLGHGNCGAVKATIEGKPVPGQISALYRYIRPAVDQAAGSGVDAVSKANAKIQATLLRQSSPVLAGLVGKEQLKVVAAFYDVASGKVELLD